MYKASKGALLRYFNDKGGGVGGGQAEVHILYPKNSIRFLAYPKKTHTSTVNYGMLTLL